MLFQQSDRSCRRVKVVDRDKKMKTVELRVSYADVEGERERVKAVADAKRGKKDHEDEWDEWGRNAFVYDWGVFFVREVECVCTTGMWRHWPSGWKRI